VLKALRTSLTVPLLALQKLKRQQIQPQSLIASRPRGVTGVRSPFSGG